MKNNELLDKPLLSSYLKTLGKATIEKMITLYEQQASLYLAEISAVVAEHQQTLWQEKCHKMKGAAGSVGFKQVHALLVDIEKSQQPMAQKKGLITQLMQLNQASLNTFHHWFKTIE
jgi:HPt (histidine-containing phosphotransfer) domain-containing protein